MQNADADAGDQAGGAGDQEGGVEHLEERGGPGDPNPEGALAANIPQVVRVVHLPGPGGDADPLGATGPGIRRHQFSLMVPFRTRDGAEIARESLAPDAEPQRGVVHKEIALNGNALVVRWTSEDPRLLRISIITFLDQLSMVVQTMQRFGPHRNR
ncbi:EKC/KEOPS complex subunit LAGE3 [Tenrec ecaudatus]|uniref:EKC/KEOPS complex subunit LAGE3 n=1 Tax=Tenrec ecaudatus TaxID=94439 RepID=UPI003F59BA46